MTETIINDENNEKLQKEIELTLENDNDNNNINDIIIDHHHDDDDKTSNNTCTTQTTEKEKQNEKTILQNKHESLEKLLDLLENNDIDEDQLRDIIRHMKEEGMHITWNHSHESILKSIGEKSAVFFQMHRTCHFYRKREHAFFTMPMFILSLMASFGNFASYKWIDDNSNLDVVKYAGLITGFMNLLIAILQKIMEFRQPEYLSIEHKNASHTFQSLNNEISIQLQLPRDEREPMPQYLNEIVKRYAETLKISPEINPKILEKARKYLKEEKCTYERMAIPEIIVGPSPISIYVKKKHKKHSEDDESHSGLVIASE